MRATISATAFAIALALGACGGPALQNVPHPNNAMVAGAAAAAAAAVTLASPRSAAARAEGNKQPNEPQPQTVKETVPSDVLDRVDHPQGSAGQGGDDAKPLAQPNGIDGDGSDALTPLGQP